MTFSAFPSSIKPSYMKFFHHHYGFPIQFIQLTIFYTRLSQTTSRHPYYSTSLQYKSPITLNQLLLSFASFLAYIPHSYLPFSQRSYPLFSREHASPPPVFAILCACVCNTHHLRVHTTSAFCLFFCCCCQSVNDHGSSRLLRLQSLEKLLVSLVSTGLGTR